MACNTPYSFNKRFLTFLISNEKYFSHKIREIFKRFLYLTKSKLKKKKKKKKKKYRKLNILFEVKIFLK